MLNFFMMLFRRWVAVSRSFLADVRSGYRRDGPFGVGLETRLWFNSLSALALGAPLILGELLALTTMTEDLRTALSVGSTPDAYVRAKCSRLGIALGSPTHHAILAFAWSFRNYLESSGRLSPAPTVEVWCDTMPG